MDLCRQFDKKILLMELSNAVVSSAINEFSFLIENIFVPFMGGKVVFCESTKTV